MDFFCQRCGKSLEIDESLLRVDLPMGDLARGDIDLDRMFAQSRNSTGYSQSHNSVALKPGNRYSAYSASVSSLTTPSSTSVGKSLLSVSSSFILPRKQAQAESPIPKNLPSHFTNRPSKTSTILLKTDKPTLSSSNLSSNSTSSSSSSSSTTPPSPSSSNTSTTNNNNPQTTTPKAASPPHYPHFPHHPPPPTTPAYSSSSNFYSTAPSTSPNHTTNGQPANPLPSPGSSVPQNPFPMQKSKSEFFRPNYSTNSTSSNSSNSSGDSVKYPNSSSISKSTLGMSQSSFAPYGSSMGSLVSK